MSVDLHERLHTAVGDPDTTHVDVAHAWQRGRRLRTARRGTVAVTAVALLVGTVGIGAALTGAPRPGIAGPVVDPDPRPPMPRDGWTRVVAGGTQPLGEVDDVIDAAGEVEEVVRLRGGAEWGWTARAWDVAADGTAYWVDADTAHVMARAPDGEIRPVGDDPLALFEDDGGRSVATALQVGPDGRLYLTAPSFQSEDVGSDQTQVGIIDPQQGLVSLRHNDPTLLYGMVFARGQGWQRHEPGRWQPIVAMDAPQVLDGDTRRGREHTGELAPDGLSLVSALEPRADRQDDTWTLRTGPDRQYTVTLPWDTPVNGTASPDSNPVSGERLVVVDGRGEGTTPSYLLRFDPQGVVDVVGVDHDVAPGLEGIGNATATIGEDGHVYWTERRPDGDLAIVRYIHPVRTGSDSGR